MYSVRHPARRYDREYIAYPIFVFSLCVAGSICRCGSGGKHGGFCFFSFPAVSMISCPHPLPPFPAGRGSLKVYFAGGFAPGTPALNRLRHLQTLRIGARAGGLFTTRVPTAPAGANAPFEAERTGFPQAMPVPRPVQPWGCKGRSPLHKKTKSLPLPRRGRALCERGRGDILPLRGRGERK